MRAGSEKNSQDHSHVSKSVLIIEDDEDSAASIQEMLKFLGHRSIIETSRDDALERLGETPFDCVIMDLRMPGMSPEVFAREVRKHFPDVHTVVASGNANVKEIAKTLKLDESLHKPVTLDELAKIINHKHARG